MPAVILLLILVVITVLLVKAIIDARQQFPGPVRRRPNQRRRRLPTPRRPPLPNERRRPAPNERRRPRPGKAAPLPDPALDEAGLDEHVEKLRSAVRGGLVSVDDAVASIRRQTGGRVSDHAARELLH